MRNRSRLRLLSGAVVIAATCLAWNQLGEAQESGSPPRVVPPQQGWPGIAPTVPEQALPTPVGRPRIIDTAPNGAIGLWSFTPEVSPRQQYTPEALAGKLLQAPISHNFPGGVAIVPGVENPYGNDPDAAKRGMQHFIAFNCVACHAPNGGGGMGPSLSDAIWRFGPEPANIFLTITHGQSTGMPAFGGMLPDKTIWELVAYVQSIAEKPSAGKGITISRAPLSPSIQQVPAEAIVTENPWAYVQPFSSGQRPTLTGTQSLPGARQSAPAPGRIPAAPAAILGAPPPLVVPERVQQERTGPNPGGPPPPALQPGSTLQPPQSVQPLPSGIAPPAGMPAPGGASPGR